ncbi:MAG: lysine-sensitive aspartokinase 3 [Acidobacteriota bacterium]|jgi:aspartate kinase|nr:lysine-sensitive aspartokinase 3 [Acidobacteriota bacterium]
MIVCKFGGTSVQDAEAMTRLAGIVKARLDRKPVVVASAMGKTTNKLLDAARLAARGERQKAVEAVRALEDSHLGEARKLGFAFDGEGKDWVYDTLQAYFKQLRDLVKGLSALGELTPRITDAVASFGERLSTVILTEALRRNGVDAELMDARDCIITDEDFTRAAPVFELTNPAIVKHLQPVLDAGRVPVFQGFIGRSRGGVTTTIGRGGSDYSAAIVGAALGAEDIQIWTDVDGVLTTDPRMVPEARRIRAISFEEAAELSYFGAKVLHPATIIPAVKKNIPVRVLNSYRPEKEGTIITEAAPPCDNPVKAISFKGGVTVVNVISTRMLMAYGFLQEIFATFARYKVPVDVVSTSEVSVSLTVDGGVDIGPIAADLEKIAEVAVERDKALVCCVGENLKNVTRALYTAMGAFKDIKIHMISQGASAINITFVIDEENMPEAVKRLHAAFFKDVDSRVFE